MPSKSPETSGAVGEKLVELGRQLRARRKYLRVSAVAAAESARMSRVTLQRIERGEPSVTMGAYLNAMTALGMDLRLDSGPASLPSAQGQDRPGWLPVRVDPANYPQLKQLAWQVGGAVELTPAEAFSIYERNWRHVDVAALEPHERHLIDALRLVFGDARNEL